MQVAERLKVCDDLVIGNDGLDMRCLHQLRPRHMKRIRELAADPRITKGQVQRRMSWFQTYI